MSDTDAAPTLQEVAQRLDADGERLRLFVEDHPDPSAAHVLGAFGGDPDAEDLVAAWLDTRESAAERAKRRREERRERRRDRWGSGGDGW